MVAGIAALLVAGKTPAGKGASSANVGSVGADGTRVLGDSQEEPEEAPWRSSSTFSLLFSRDPDKAWLDPFAEVVTRVAASHVACWWRESFERMKG